MRTTRIAIAVVLSLIGAVWIGQGTGVIAGSVMTGSSFWAIVGLGCVLAAAVVAGVELRRRRRTS